MLMINKAIAEATEESHKISTLRANGLLDADACAVRMNAISAKLTQLRGERRWLSENEALDASSPRMVFALPASSSPGMRTSTNSPAMFSVSSLLRSVPFRGPISGAMSV